MQHNGKSFGNIEVKSPRIRKDCGYQKQFKYNVDMNSNGILGECIEWCENHCRYKWGWWFEGPDDPVDNYHQHWENQRAWMSFANKKEATAFLIAVGIKNMGKN